MGSLFQQLYSFVDTIMVGRLISSNALAAVGYSAYSVFSGICEMIGKSAGGLLAVKWLGFWGICVATPLAWFPAMVYCGILVLHFLKKRLQTQQIPNIPQAS